MLLAQIILVAQVCHLRIACDGLTLGIPQFMRISKKKNDIFKKMLGNCCTIVTQFEGIICTNCVTCTNNVICTNCVIHLHNHVD